MVSWTMNFVTFKVGKGKNDSIGRIIDTELCIEVLTDGCGMIEGKDALSSVKFLIT